MQEKKLQAPSIQKSALVFFQKYEPTLIKKWMNIANLSKNGATYNRNK